VAYLDDEPEFELAFDNTYSTSGTSLTIKGMKNATGQKLKGGDFTFNILDLDGSLVESGHNRMNGLIALGLTFEAVGTYDYIIVEDQTNPKAGWIYDKTEYSLRVVVEDNRYGQLVVSMVYLDDIQIDNITSSNDIEFIAMLTDALVFNNAYTPADGSIELEAFKTAVGRALKDEEFNFI